MKRAALLVSLIMILTGFSAAQTSNIDTAIVASTVNFPDALISAAPANKLGAPVLLTDKDNLTASTRATLENHKVQNVVIVGGPAVVSSGVESEIDSLVNDTTRLWGMTQVGTSVEVAEYFWSEGSDSVTIVQYPQSGDAYWNQSFKLLNAVKNEVQDEDEPILISKEGTLSAEVLSAVEALNATEAEVYSTNAVNVTQDLESVGVTEIEIEQGEAEELSDEIQNRTSIRQNNSQLIIVAAANFRHAISVPTSPNSASFVVGSREQISTAVELIRNSEAEQIKVAGKPELAEEIASRIENETDRSVTRLSGRPEEVASKVTDDRIEDFRERQRERLEEWREEVRESEHVKHSANRTIEHARSFIDENSSQRAQDLFLAAENAYQNGHYFIAKRKALKAVSMEKAEYYHSLNQTERLEENAQEREGIRDAISDLKEMNTERAQELMEAETREEKLEILQEFREERREIQKEIREEARETATGSYRLKLKAEGHRVGGEARYLGPAGMSQSSSVTRNGSSLEFRFELEGNGTGVTRYRFENARKLEEGTYDVSVTFVANGETVNTLSRTIEVPGFVEYQARMEKEFDREDARERLEKEFREELNDSDDFEENHTDENETEVIDVSATEYEFNPRTIEAEKGDTLVFVNEGGVTHNVHVEELGFDKDIAPGERVELRVDHTGEFELVCDYHLAQDMTGTISVQ